MPMHPRDLLPSAALALSVTLAIAGSQLLPGDDAPVLVRLGDAGIERLFADPVLQDVALVDTPAPGFAVLKGDAGRIRSSLGLTVAWNGKTPCSPNQ